MIYTDFSAENYRGIRQCKLHDLELVNLLFGKNNCGKSSLLEAILILSGPDNPTLPIMANNMRALNSLEEADLKVEFYQAIPENIITLSSQGEQNRQVSIQMIESYSKNIPLEQLKQVSSETVGKHYGLKINFSTGSEKKYHSELIVTEENQGKVTSDKVYKEELYAEYIPSNHMQINVAEKLTEIIKNKQEADVLEALRIVEPRITDLQLVGNKVMVDIGLPTRLPINVLGDGVRKVLAIILSIYKCRNGVLLIDELDNGLHFSIMPQLWKAILYTCRKHHTQLFASTHSLDLVKSLVQTISKSDEAQPVAAYKLIRKENDELATLRYSSQELTYAINQEMEVR
mgnify:CR=1 FL=1